MSEANNPYPFDAEHREVPITMEIDNETIYTFAHRLRKPTQQELIERESQTVYEMVEASSREDEIRADDEAANIRLWEKTSLAVAGYSGTDGWYELKPEDRERMKPGHKSAAIRALYKARYFIEGKENGVSIGPDSWTVRQEIGPKKQAPEFIVRHTFREPTEAERMKFRRSAKSTSYLKGAQNTQVYIRTNLKAYIEMYDALIENIDGGTVGGMAFSNGMDRKAFLRAVDAFWKKELIEKFMQALEAQFSD